MHQFEIKRLIPLELFGFDASFTNSALFMVIAGTIITLFTVYAMRNRALVPSRLQSVAELSYEFVANMVRDNAGTDGMKYFPFVFTLFMFVLVLNMLGMVPYSFTVPSHIIVTFALAAFIFVAVTLIGFIKHGVKFLKFFVPEGVPLVMLPLLVVIEVISYLTRPLSLSVRLFANMMAGHTMLKVFGAFVVALGLFGGWAPLAFMVACSPFSLASISTTLFTCITSFTGKPPTSYQREREMDPSAAKLIGAGLASIALVGAGVGIGTIFGNYL